MEKYYKEVESKFTNRNEKPTKEMFEETLDIFLENNCINYYLDIILINKSFLVIKLDDKYYKKAEKIIEDNDLEMYEHFNKFYDYKYTCKQRMDYLSKAMDKLTEKNQYNTLLINVCNKETMRLLIRNTDNFGLRLKFEALFRDKI